MKSSGIGGQAVLEGIMMKNKDQYAVAVRKPNHEIEVKKDTYPGIASKYAWMRVPFVRGVFNFVDSLVLGMSTLTFSASFYEDEEEEEPEREDAPPSFWEKHFSSEQLEGIMMTGTVILSVILAVAVFMVLPMFCARFFERFLDSHLAVAALEGLIRMVIFILYVWGISFMKDIKRTYMYHGAEHKCINCIEHGLPLTVENVRISSRQHKRCGTSFLLFVMLISIVVFMFLQMDNVFLRFLSRIVFVPVIAGISYEVLRLAGNSDGRLINLVSKPGLMLQKLTTAEPDDEMIEVAIQAVEAVFDWRAYEEENFPHDRAGAGA